MTKPTGNNETNYYGSPQDTSLQRRPRPAPPSQLWQQVTAVLTTASTVAAGSRLPGTDVRAGCLFPPVIKHLRFGGGGGGSPRAWHLHRLLPGLCWAGWEEDLGRHVVGNGVPGAGGRGSFSAVRTAFPTTVCGPRGRSGGRAPPNNGPLRIVLPAAARRSAASKGPRATRHRGGRGGRGLAAGAAHKGWPWGNLGSFASTG